MNVIVKYLFHKNAVFVNNQHISLIYVRINGQFNSLSSIDDNPLFAMWDWG
jgi:hypothetical protein